MVGFVVGDVATGESVNGEVDGDKEEKASKSLLLSTEGIVELFDEGEEEVGGVVAVVGEVEGDALEEPLPLGTLEEERRRGTGGARSSSSSLGFSDKSTSKS